MKYDVIYQSKSKLNTLKSLYAVTSLPYEFRLTSKRPVVRIICPRNVACLYMVFLWTYAQVMISYDNMLG